MSSPAPAPSLITATIAFLVRTAIEHLPVSPGCTPEDAAALRRAALAFIACLRPRDPLEAALAARAVTAQFATMDAFRCAAQPDLAASLLLRHQGRALQMSRLMDKTLADLERRQKQPVLGPAELPAEVQAAMEQVARALEAAPAQAQVAGPAAAQAAAPAAVQASAPTPDAAPAASGMPASKPDRHPPATSAPAAKQPPTPSRSAPGRQSGPITPELEKEMMRNIAARSETALPPLAA